MQSTFYPPLIKVREGLRGIFELSIVTNFEFQYDLAAEGNAGLGGGGGKLEEG